VPAATRGDPAMTTVLDKQLLIVTGKGGAGKTTIATAAAILAAREGRRTIVVELAAPGRIPALFGAEAGEPGAEVMLKDNLSALAIDPDRALLEWLQALGGRVPGRVLASSGTFQYFAAAAPGAKELVSMIKIWELTQAKRWRRRSAGYDLVVLDAPATGHAIGLLQSPRTFGAIARVGVVATQTRHVQELLADEARTAYVAVATPTELAIEETLELEQRLQEGLSRTLDTVLINATIPQRFSAADIRALSRASTDAADDGDPEAAKLAHAALAAALAAHERARFQHALIARLRRRHMPVHTLPFQFERELDVACIERIASALARALRPQPGGSP
jgi:anion-transporting  ArsA/GET3 family ATPase